MSAQLQYFRFQVNLDLVNVLKPYLNDDENRDSMNLSPFLSSVVMRRKASHSLVFSSFE